jgi:cardiolipin synthase (CMP-forming)
VNLPNAITLFRFALIPLYITVFFSGMAHYVFYSFCILFLAGVTDVLDGYLARRNGQVTEIGIMLDPLADKMMVLTVVISLIVAHEIPFIVAALMLVRELGMIITSAFFYFRGKKTVPATVWGKATTVVYYIAIVSSMFEWPFALPLLWLTVILSFVTSFVYLVKFRDINDMKDIHLKWTRSEQGKPESKVAAEAGASDSVGDSDGGSILGANVLQTMTSIEIEDLKKKPTP